jgi:hypothetical protein
MHMIKKNLKSSLVLNIQMVLNYLRIYGFSKVFVGNLIQKYVFYWT